MVRYEVMFQSLLYLSTQIKHFKFILYVRLYVNMSSCVLYSTQVMRCCGAAAESCSVLRDLGLRGAG